MELSIFARYHALEGQEAVVAAALRDEVGPSRAEPGCPAHAAYHCVRDPRLFRIHSRWIDEVAFEIHVELPHTLRFVERVQPLNLGAADLRPSPGPSQPPLTSISLRDYRHELCESEHQASTREQV